MARTRAIKPAFFTNEELVELEPCVRLLFIGLWTLADRRGLLEYKPKRIKMQLFPGDALDLPQACLRLALSELIEIYEIEENFKKRTFIKITNFVKHQHIHHKEVENDCPEPLENTDSQRKPQTCLGLDSVQPVCYNCYNCYNCDNGKPHPPGSARPPASTRPPVSPVLVNNTKTGISAAKKNKKSTITVKRVVDLYHECLPTLRAVAKITPVRQQQITQRINSDLATETEWRNYFDYVSQSDFLMGRANATPGRKIFSADLQWITKATKFVEISEGKYHGD